MRSGVEQGGLVNIAIVGLGFGEDFLPIYQAHPAVGALAIVDPSEERRTVVGDRYGIPDRFESLDAVLADDRWHAVHILAPVPFHAEYTLAVLNAGKHCACAVPMATSLDDLAAIVDAQRRTGKQYMMMETSAYGREYLLAKHLYDSGALGDVAFYEGFHIQNIDGYPEYWRGYPPMHYSTHALSPILALTGRRVREVVCRGSGSLTPDRRGRYDNPFPVELGLFALDGAEISASVTMSFFQTARSYTEGFRLYGSEVSLEWPSIEGEPLRMFELQPLDPDQPTTGLRGRRSQVTEPSYLDPGTMLPAELAVFADDFLVTPADGAAAFLKKAEHGGSHPYLVHEFLSSIVEDRPSRIDAVTAADWTAPGICAHRSALDGGVPVQVPDYREPRAR
jgi:predicted dehydrogenase